MRQETKLLQTTLSDWNASKFGIHRISTGTVIQRHFQGPGYFSPMIHHEFGGVLVAVTFVDVPIGVRKTEIAAFSNLVLRKNNVAKLSRAIMRERPLVVERVQ